MPETMHAAVVEEFGRPLLIKSVPVPDPDHDEVLIRVVACGVCHTDLHAADGDWPIKPHLPFIPGHEVAGVVSKLGRDVDNLHVGDRVGVAWLHDACLACEYCETGWETLCEHQHNTGYSCDGGFAQYVVARAQFVAKLPDTLDFGPAAPILCAGVTAYKGLKETEARPGQWVAVSGVGGLGHMAIQYAKAMGLRVAAIDVAPQKLELATRLGADLAVDAHMPDATAKILAATGGGAHGVLVTAVSRPAFAASLEIARRRGTVVLVGLPPGEFPVPIFDVVLKRLTLRGSIVGTRRDLDEALDFAARGDVKAEIATVPLTEVNRVLADLKAGRVAGRIVLDPTGQGLVGHARKEAAAA